MTQCEALGADHSRSIRILDTNSSLKRAKRFNIHNRRATARTAYLVALDPFLGDFEGHGEQDPTRRRHVLLVCSGASLRRVELGPLVSGSQKEEEVLGAHIHHDHPTAPCDAGASKVLLTFDADQHDRTRVDDTRTMIFGVLIEILSRHLSFTGIYARVQTPGQSVRGYLY
jgi:hypothetical protein